MYSNNTYLFIYLFNN